MSKKLIEATAAIAQPIAERMGLELIDVEYKKEAVGMVLTGIFASRGANFVSDLIGRLRGKKAE